MHCHNFLDYLSLAFATNTWHFVRCKIGHCLCEIRLSQKQDSFLLYLWNIHMYSKNSRMIDLPGLGNNYGEKQKLRGSFSCHITGDSPVGFCTIISHLFTHSSQHIFTLSSNQSLFQRRTLSFYRILLTQTWLFRKQNALWLQLRQPLCWFCQIRSEPYNDMLLVTLSQFFSPWHKSLKVASLKNFH